MIYRGAWVVLVVVAVSQSVPGTWCAMMVVNLQVVQLFQKILESLLSLTILTVRVRHVLGTMQVTLFFFLDGECYPQTLSVGGESLTEEWIDGLAVTASVLGNVVAIIGARCFSKCIYKAQFQ